MRALEKDAAKRQQSAEELDNECQLCLAELFPRQTPGPGALPAVAAPPGGQVPRETPVARAPGVAEQRTMMATEAPKLGLQPASPLAEQKTMMAQAAPKQPGGEMKTMMATEAPKLGAGPPPAESYGAPPPSAPPAAYGPAASTPSAPPPAYGPPPPAASPKAAPASAEQKTMMAMEAPRIGGGLAPPPAAPPPPTAPQQRTMMAPAAPLSAQRTMMAPAGAAVAEGGTKILPDSAGVVAYATERARQARHSSQHETPAAPPAGALFWIAWIVLGIGSGIGIHYYLMQRG